MKRSLTILLAGICLSGTTVVALPPMQHLAKGAVTAIDRGRIEIALERPAKDVPTNFVITEGRTRLRKDGKKTAAERPAIGQFVTLYYRNEFGEWVATEISWKTVPPPRR